MTTESTPISFQKTVLGTACKVCLQGSLCDDGIADARKMFTDLLESGTKTVGVEMSGVDYISSAGIGMLVSVLKRCQQDRVKLALIALNDDIRELFTLTRLDQVFVIVPSVQSWETALKR
ncbi:MAG: STAS domain-containing protein [Planctomycetota bacterium]